MVPPERVELSSPAPEAGTLSTELQGHYTTKNITLEPRPTRTRHGPFDDRPVAAWQRNGRRSDHVRQPASDSLP